MLEKLKKLNPTLRIFAVSSPEFSEYGEVISLLDTQEILNAAEAIARPAEGSLYSASEPSFEELSVAEDIRNGFFGTLPIQVGYCHGYSNYLNAAEWHSASEVNIATSDLVLILGKRSDIKNGKLNSADMKAFYLPRGTAVEVYATTLHFCPCQVSDSGFGCVVALPLGTNVPLDAPVDDPRLFRKNKWIIAHEENSALIARGVVPGIYGENYKINY